MNKEKTVQKNRKIDLEAETVRLIGAFIYCYFYDTAIPGKIGIVVNNNDLKYSMEKRITEAGYVYAGACPKKQGCTLYTIDEETLVEIQRNKKNKLKNL